MRAIVSGDTKSNMAERRRRELGPRILQLPGIGMLGHYRYTRAQGVMGPHDHKHQLEICHLLRGRQTYAVGGSVYRLSGGDCYLTLPHERHDTHGEREEPGELFWLILDPEHPNLLHLPAASARALGEALLDLPQRHFPAAPGSEALLREALEASGPLGIARRCSALTAYLLRLIEAAAARRSSHSPAIARCLERIAANLHGPLPVPLLAHWAGLSRSRFKIRFRQEVGLPPAEYVQRQRIAAAQRLLLGGRSVLDVAQAVGFSSSQYFATVFRRFTAQSPRQWLSGGSSRDTFAS